MAKQLRILSLGAGVQSSTLALMIEYGEVPMVDCAIFADTGNEPKEVYKWLDYLKGKLSYPLYIVDNGNLKQDSLDSNFLKIPVFTKNTVTEEKGFGRRQCTREYKIYPIQRKVRELLGLKKHQRVPKDTKVEMLIGISKDEMSRMASSRDWWIDNQYPLVLEKQFSRIDCYNWLKNNNHPIPDKSACTYCPFNSNSSWLRHKKDPEEWVQLIKFDKEIRNKIRYKDVEAYLHKDCVPLDEAELDPHKDQMDMFNDICDEGMCGV